MIIDYEVLNVTNNTIGDVRKLIDLTKTGTNKNVTKH